MRTASNKNATDITNSSNWNRPVLLSQLIKLTFDKLNPTTSVPHVGYKTLVYPSPNKKAKIMMFTLIPGKGDKVNSGIKSNAFASEPGIKNSKIRIIKYNKITET